MRMEGFVSLLDVVGERRSIWIDINPIAQLLTFMSTLGKFTIWAATVGAICWQNGTKTPLVELNSCLIAIEDGSTTCAFDAQALDHARRVMFTTNTVYLWIRGRKGNDNELSRFLTTRPA